MTSQRKLWILIPKLNTDNQSIFFLTLIQVEDGGTGGHEELALRCKQKNAPLFLLTAKFYVGRFYVCNCSVAGLWYESKVCVGQHVCPFSGMFFDCLSHRQRER